MLRISELKKHYINDLGEKKIIFNDLEFKAKEGEFISIIGGNGAGKTTFFNSIIGNTTVSGGTISIAGKDITNLDKHLRNKIISKVYQDPSRGTSPSMTIYENLSMADNKGKSFNLTWGLNHKRKEKYKKFLADLNLGLENHLNTKVGNLSGGQRQCLSLIMSVLASPKLLLLDEHTAALDPKISKIIMDKTEEIVKQNGITTLMITHELQDAIDYGDRLIMLSNGKIVLDVSGEEKKNLTKKELLSYYI